MLGIANVTGLQTHDFGDRFRPYDAKESFANIAPETSQGFNSNALGIVKSWTSGEGIVFERKHCDSATEVPSSKLIFASNFLPHVDDSSSGMWRRMQLIPFLRVVPAADRRKATQADKNYASASWWVKSGMAPAIFAWAVEGLARLKKNGQFSHSAVSEAHKANYRDQCHPEQEFLLANYTDTGSDSDFIASELIYDQYVTYSELKGGSTLSNAALMARLKRLFPKATSGRRTVSGIQKRGYVGLCESLDT